jgi:hypothetical protein
MYKAVVRYSRENVLSGDIRNIIELDRVKSVTIQGVEFDVVTQL